MSLEETTVAAKAATERGIEGRRMGGSSAIARMSIQMTAMKDRNKESRQGDESG